MAIFQTPNPKRDTAPAPDTALGRHPDPNEFSFGSATTPAAAAQQAPRTGRELKESVIAADLTIEGRIQGAGNVRIAGRFSGDIAVEGDLTIEAGARVNGGVRARRVVIAGELEGNIEAAQRVELVESGAMTGDVKAGVVTVAPGSRMRGQVEFGWEVAAAVVPASTRKGTADATPETGASA
jgi:cytoskeletal protein CcmA (bactofilin family)